MAAIGQTQGSTSELGSRIQGKILVIAGSDSSGGAGLEADQKVIAAHGCYAMTATTALTAQNTTGVSGIHHIPTDFVRKQIDAVFTDIQPDVVKTGMLASASTIEMLATAFKEYHVDKLILDPVMVATTGAVLLPPEAVKDMRTLLLPQTFIVTPNIPECRLLLIDAGNEPIEINKIGDLEELARQTQKLGPKWILIKGGHVPFKKDGTIAKEAEERELVVDVLFGEGQITRFVSPYQKSRNTHGTGCSLASAIASNIAKGLEPVEAVRAASRYIEAGIRTAPDYGHGNGPLNHFHSVYTLPFTPGRFIEYLLNRPDVAPVWHRLSLLGPFCTGKCFGIVQGKQYGGCRSGLCPIFLPWRSVEQNQTDKSSFSFYAVGRQDRKPHQHGDVPAPGLLRGLRDPQGADRGDRGAHGLHGVHALRARRGHGGRLAGSAARPGPLPAGLRRRRPDAVRRDDTVRDDGNIYYKWILNYVADDYVGAVRTGSELIERHAVLLGPSRVEELVKIFIHATKMEIGFWEMFPYE
ncbi:hypothetical protein G7054_g662 [Neopestalotiopsis clavispora]|nr:hypothetical protein G7054_g662 [Neopestalotiopsis clavispora]